MSKETIEKLLALARSPLPAGSSSNEAETAAGKALVRMTEEGLVFHPESTLLSTALAQHTAADGPDRRRTALMVARASTGAAVVTQAERQAFRAPPPATAPAVAQGQRLRDMATEAFRTGRDFLSVLAGDVEVADGVSVRSAAQGVRRSMDDLEREVDEFRRQVDSTLGRGAPRAPKAKGPKTPKRKPPAVKRRRR